MTTRFYLPSSGSVSASATYNAGWENTTIAASRPAVTTKLSTSMSTVSLAGDTNKVDQDILYRQYISGSLAAQTIAVQTVKFQIRAQETNAANNLYTVIDIRSWNGASTFKNIVSMARDDTELSASGLQNRQFSVSCASIVVAEGERLVIEIGVGGDPAQSGADGHNSSIRVGDGAAGDLPENSSSGDDLNPWVEFANTLSFWVPPVNFVGAHSTQVQKSTTGSMLSQHSIAGFQSTQRHVSNTPIVLVGANSTQQHVSTSGSTFIPQTPPTVVINTPDGYMTTGSTPSLELLGTDPNGERITYNLTLWDTSTCVCDFMSGSYGNGWSSWGETKTGLGQRFTGDGRRLDSFDFEIYRIGTLSGSLTPKIYNLIFTGGVWVPGGSPLAVGTPKPAMDVGTSSGMITFEFPSDNQPILTAGCSLGAVVENTADVWGETIQTLYFTQNENQGGGNHSGAQFYRNGQPPIADYSVDETVDLVFTVRTKEVLLDVNSADDPGFTNLDNPSDTSPFASGSRVSYKIQDANALAVGTYGFEARGKDPTGGNSYGNRSAPGRVKRYIPFVGADSTEVHVSTSGSVQLPDMTVALSGSSSTQLQASTSGSLQTLHAMVGASNTQIHGSTSGSLQSSHILGGNHSTQIQASTTGSVVQTHGVQGAHNTQAHSSNSDSIVQGHILSGLNSTQVQASSTGGLQSTHLLSGADTTQIHVSSTGCVVMDVVEQNLEGENSTQLQVSDTGSLVSAHLLSGLENTQIQTSQTGAITQSAILAGESNTQLQKSDTGLLIQTHNQAGLSGAQAHCSDTGELIQTQLLSGLDSTQIHVSSTGTTSQSIILQGESTTQVHSSTTGSLNQDHALSGLDSTQIQSSSSGLFTYGTTRVQVSWVEFVLPPWQPVSMVTLSGSSGTQVHVSETGVLVQTHALSGANSTQLQVSSAGSLIQTQATQGQSSTHIQVSTAGSLVQSALVAGADSTQVQVSEAGILVQTQITAGESTTHVHISTSGGLGQSHLLSGADATHVHVSSTGALSQNHALAGASSTQVHVSSTGATSQAQALEGISSTHIHASSSGLLIQIQQLSGTPSTQVHRSTSGALGQAHALAGENSTQIHVSSTGAVVEAETLTGENSTHLHVSSTDVLVQTHALSGQNSTQLQVSTTGSIVQTHVTNGQSSTQVQIASTGSLTVTHNLAGTSSTQAQVSSTGSAILTFILNGENSVQLQVSNAGGATQTHLLAGTSSTQIQTSSTGDLVCTYLLGGQNSTQLHISTQGDIAVFVLQGENSTQAHKSWVRYPASLFGLKARAFVCMEMEVNRVYVCNLISGDVAVCDEMDQNVIGIAGGISARTLAHKEELSAKAHITV